MDESQKIEPRIILTAEPLPLASGEDERGLFQDAEMQDVRVGDYVDGIGHVAELRSHGALVILWASAELALRGGPTRRVRTRPTLRTVAD